MTQDNWWFIDAPRAAHNLRQLVYFMRNLHTNQKDSPCSKGENVPASMLMYGSILSDVTAMPHELRIVPKDDAITPLPTPEITPPVTKIYFIFLASRCWCFVDTSDKCDFLRETCAKLFTIRRCLQLLRLDLMIWDKIIQFEMWTDFLYNFFLAWALVSFLTLFFYDLFSFSSHTLRGRIQVSRI